MLKILEKYSNAAGVSGFENEIRDRIKEEVASVAASIETDFMGNLYVTQKCGKKNAKKVLLVAHMDEVGFFIDSVTESGLLTFHIMGGIDPRVLVSKAVLVGNAKIPGVIGAKPIHLQKKGERGSPISADALYIDIGVQSKDAALAVVKLGDPAVFDVQCVEQEDVIMGKAFDDRAGCAVMTEVLLAGKKAKYDVDITAVFTVQEEVGLRGAAILATTAGDVPMKKDMSPSTELRKGPALSFMDLTTIGFRSLIHHAEAIAKKNKIPFQYKRTVSGGTDIGAIHTKGGIPAMVISVPVRYIHAPKGILATIDYKNTLKLAVEMIKTVKEAL